LKNLKLTTRLKNKPWTHPQIKSHKKNHELRLRDHRHDKNPEHVFKFLSSVEKIVNLHGFK